MADPRVDVEQAAEAYRLYRHDGLSQRAVAERLGIAQSTVSAHIRRGRAAVAAVALHSIAEKRLESDGFLVDLREWLEEQRDACQSVTEAATLARELRQIEARRAALLGLDMPTQLAISTDRPLPVPNPDIVAAIVAAEAEARREEAEIRGPVR